MKHLLDTDWVVDYLKGRKPIVERLATLSHEGLAISLISYGEMYEGIYFGRDPQRYEAGFRKFLRGVTVLPLDRTIMRRFARLRGELRGKGQLIGDPDLLIAATALHHELTLFTHNTRHFGRIANLRLNDSHSSPQS